MQHIDTTLMGLFPVKSPIYDSAAEYDNAAGREGAALEATNAYFRFHIWNGAARNAICDVVQKATRVKPITENRDGKDVVMETETVYVKRALKESGVTPESLVVKVQEATAALDVKPGSARRSGGGGKTAKKWYDIVKNWRDAGKLDAFVAKVGLEDALDACVDDEARENLLANKAKTVITAAQKELEAAF